MQRNARHGVRFRSLLLLGCLLVTGADWGHHSNQSSASVPSDAGFWTGPAATIPSLIASKQLDAPTMDGQCADPAYDEQGTVRIGAGTTAGIPVKLVHSAIDLYVCFEAMSFSVGQRALVRVDSDLSRSAKIGQGDYEFSAGSDGTHRVRQGNNTGAWATFAIPASDFAAEMRQQDGRIWSVELRISLEWLGGFARTDGLHLAREQAATAQQWPPSSNALSPATWGSLILAPVYPTDLNTGSAFVDGREGYLVVPYSPALNPPEISIEAWVRVVGGDCGTLVGNGLLQSYWLALCEVVRFGHAGTGTIRLGQTPLDDGWHHVAVTMALPMENGGIRTVYVDGQVDAEPGWEPAQEAVPGENEQDARLGLSDRMLRIGSDREAGTDFDGLHGYVRELRIWNRVRSAAEIRGTAFQNLTGRETGLVGLWPFTHGLQDLAGGHHAGLIGNASLARATRDVTAFPRRAPAPNIPYPGRAPIKAWDARIPTRAVTAQLNGLCLADEYAGAAKLRLEPERGMFMKTFIGRDALYLCTNILWGKLGDGSMTLYLTGQGTRTTVPAAPSRGALRLRLRPDGRLLANTGDGRGFGGPPPAGIATSVISDTNFSFQEDLFPVNAPWWSGEFRIPFSALEPFEPGDALRLAVQYDGAIPANTWPDQPTKTIVNESWPADFDPLQPATWGQVTTTKQQVARSVYLPIAHSTLTVASERAATEETPARVQSASSITPETVSPSLAADSNVFPIKQGATPAHTPSEDWPRQPPTTSAFYDHCPDSGPIQAFYAFDSDFKWPMVDPSNNPIVQVEGIVHKSYVSTIDSPLIHDSHDLDMHITLDQKDRWITVDAADNLVLESESAYFPHKARPSVGDHVTTKGRWIFDCGHEPKTEIHPTPYIASDRLELRPSGLGGEFEQVRMVRVWMNSSPGAFGFNLNNLGPFEFDVQMPPDYYGYIARLPFVRIIEGSGSAVETTITGSTVHFKVTPPAALGGHYWEMMVGNLIEVSGVCPPSCGSNGIQDVFTVTFDQIRIHDDHDDAFFRGDGDWHMAINVNGTWRQLFTEAQFDEDDSPYVIFPPLSVTVVGGHLDIQVTAFENDSVGSLTVWEDDEAITSGTWDVGFLPDMAGNSFWLDPGGGTDWELHYSVVKAGSVEPALPSANFWSPRLEDEWFKLLGTLHVPAQGAAQLSTSETAFLTEPGFTNGGVRVLSRDRDRFDYTLDEFANVTYGSLPAGLTVVEKYKDPWYFAGSLPQNLKDLLGFRSAQLEVKSDSGAAGNVQYTMQVKRTWRVLPPDPGEVDDNLLGGDTGRLVDLLTPEPGTDVSITSVPFADPQEHREREEPWAWQHTATDADHYDIHIPKVKERPKGMPVTDCDVEGQLEIDAWGMRVRIPSKNIDVENHLVQTSLNTRFPTGRVAVTVQSSSGQRGFYRLNAHWSDAVYYTEDACELKKALDALRKRLAGIRAINIRSIYIPELDLGNPAPELEQVEIFELGGYNGLQMNRANVLDIVLSSPGTQPVTGRLYDLDGVLLGESIALDAEAGLGQTRVPDGVMPQGRLTVAGLEAGGQYLFQTVPDFALGAGAATEVFVGASIAK